MKIAAVSYLNTKPLISGLELSKELENIDLHLVVPSLCSQMLLEGEVDIALVPVGSLWLFPKNFRIVTNYCIGAEGKVDSVLLLSQKPLHEIDTIYLDPDSQTSVELVKLLAKEHWKIQPEWAPAKGVENPESVVLIGDKTFSKRKEYRYQYDLAEAWQEYTGLPFVFACWLANENVSDKFCQQLNNAFELGIQNIPKLVKQIKTPDLDEDALRYYYEKSIKYQLSPKKLEALALFLQKGFGISLNDFIR